MNAKEAVKRLRNVSYDDRHSCMLTETHSYELDVLEQVAARLEELETPPTAEEVCEALNTAVQLYPKIFYYDEISKTFKEIHLSRNEEIVSYYTNKTITINPNYGIPPHLITLIGRFYEAQQ